MKITIADVARKAGVSAGTVDRVLHGRGEVSATSAEKVRRAVSELNFKPNIFASMLATRQACVLAVLLPKFTDGSYWEKIYNGYLAGAAQLSSLDVRLNFFFFDQDDVLSFRSACSEALQSSPSGVALSPVFKNEALVFADTLFKQRIPYVYVDTKVEDPNYFSFFGMPMYQSGYLSAVLLTERCMAEDLKSVALVGIKRNKNRQSDPTIVRREGFTDYMERHYPSCELLKVDIDADDPEKTCEILDEFASRHPGVRQMVMFNSRVHLLGPWLRKNPMNGRRVIGYDGLDRNIELLKRSLVDALISQKIDDQASRAVSVLANYIILQRKPESRDNYLHMDILTRFNIENY